MIDKETQFFTKHMEDLARRAERDSYCLCSGFLTPHERKLLMEMAPGLPVKVSFDGGHEDAERVVAVFAPQELVPVSDLVCLKISLPGVDFAAEAPGHQDYLGALMGLGFEREKIGDIVVAGTSAYLWAKEDMAAFIKENLTSVGSQIAAVEETVWDEAFAGVVKKEAVVSLNSLRLDAVVSRCFNLSRGDGSLAVKQGKIFIDGVLAEKTDRAVKIGETVTFRGKGKVVLAEEVGRSKSDRQQVRIIKYGGK